MRTNMKLYSAGTQSYAYISLDSSKAVKLDANTKVQVRKQGSKLELLVTSGKLFFNVKAPLSSNQSLNIRTSTMVTGIRGSGDFANGNSNFDSAKTQIVGTFTTSGRFINRQSSTVNISGILTISAGGSLSNGAITINTGTLTNNGTYENSYDQETGTVTNNNGTLNGSNPIVPTP